MIQLYFVHFSIHLFKLLKHISILNIFKEITLFTVMNKDSRKTIKVKFKKIKHPHIDYRFFNKCIIDANKIVHAGYLFLRSYLLYIIENDLTEPIINVPFIRMVFSVVTTNTNKKLGRPYNNRDEYNNLLKYFQIFRSETSYESIDATRLSYILGQEYEQIYTSIVNNIQLHFNKHINAFIKANFSDLYNTLKENNDKKKLDMLKKLKNELLNDFLKNENTCIHYNDWTDKMREKIIPETYTPSTFMTDVDKNTFKYIKCMHYMNKYIQKKDLESYQIIPIRTAYYSKSVKINTNALIDIFYNKEKLEKLSKSGDLHLQEQEWNKFFNLKLNGIYKYKINQYSFNYEISTDGYCASLNFIHNDEIPKKEKAKKSKRDARKNTFDKKLTKEERIEYNKNKREEILQKKEKQRKDAKERSKKKRDEFIPIPISNIHLDIGMFIYKSDYIYNCSNWIKIKLSFENSRNQIKILFLFD